MRLRAASFFVILAAFVAGVSPVYSAEAREPRCDPSPYRRACKVDKITNEMSCGMAIVRDDPSAVAYVEVFEPTIGKNLRMSLGVYVDILDPGTGEWLGACEVGEMGFCSPQAPPKSRWFILAIDLKCGDGYISYAFLSRLLGDGYAESKPYSEVSLVELGINGKESPFLLEYIRRRADLLRPSSFVKSSE